MLQAPSANGLAGDVFATVAQSPFKRLSHATLSACDNVMFIPIKLLFSDVQDRTDRIRQPSQRFR